MLNFYVNIELFFSRMHHFYIFQYFLIMTGISLTNLQKCRLRPINQIFTAAYFETVLLSTVDACTFRTPKNML